MLHDGGPEVPQFEGIWVLEKRLDVLNTTGSCCADTTAMATLARIARSANIVEESLSSVLCASSDS
jgi:hypothetical protein